jgi:hypothetical protein
VPKRAQSASHSLIVVESGGVVCRARLCGAIGGGGCGDGLDGRCLPLDWKWLHRSAHSSVSGFSRRRDLRVALSSEEPGCL